MLNVPCHGVLLKEIVGLLEKSTAESLREIQKKIEFFSLALLSKVSFVTSMFRVDS